MYNQQSVKVEVNFNDLLNVNFVAEEIPCERGKIFREKNFEKKISDLAHITLFSEEKRIMLRIGVFYLPFIVKSGNLDTFEGRYEISYAGHDGFAEVVYCECE